MKITGLLLMPAGLFIVLSAVVMLRAFVAESLFVAAGMGVEVLGLILFARSHRLAKGGSE
jgi:hypothetical protein